MGTVVGMAATGNVTSTSASLCNVDVPKDGNLVGLSYSAAVDLDADGEYAEFEISFGSSPTFGTNDSRSRIASFKTGYWSMTTSGAAPSHANGSVILPDITCGAGERIYLHGVGAATTAVRVDVNLYFDFDLDKTPVRRR